MNPFKVFLLTVFVIASLSSAAQTNASSPSLKEILQSAQSDTERYQLLYNLHAQARAEGTNVDYSSVEGTVINLAIPPNAKTIPLTDLNDFHNVTFVVTNNTHHLTLFSLAQSTQDIDINPMLLDSGDFTSIPELCNGNYLLILADQTPWVAERIGYGSPAMRRDVLHITDGHSENLPIASYRTPATKAHCSYTPVTTTPKIIKNLHLQRHPRSTFKTYLLNINAEYNVQISNVTVRTPQYRQFKRSAALKAIFSSPNCKAAPSPKEWQKTQTKLTADGVIGLNNCADINLTDVAIDGTYTVPGSYGYALSANNTYNVSFTRFIADANWGVFGSNNMSQTCLRACDLNRFDIHCYGRDVQCIDCTFRNKQTQFGSFYGTVRFDSCRFIDCIPVRIRASYNAYTPFNIEMNHCTFQPSLRYHHLVNVMLLDTAVNKRPELSERCWPNLTVHDLTVIMPALINKLVLYHPTGTLSVCRHPVSYLSQINIEGLTVVSPARLCPVTIQVTTTPITTKQPLTLHTSQIVYRRDKNKTIAVENDINKQ